jgi:hypothetical protein
MRKVKVFSYKWNSTLRCNEVMGFKVGKFHQFGTNYEDFENGTGNFSVAIIEFDDGTVDSFPVTYIQFID